MTYLEIVNKVLRRLREDEVTDFSSDYARLIAEFVAEIHTEVIEAHDWSFFDYQVVLNVTAGVNDYLLDSTTINLDYTTDNGKPLNRSAMLRYTNGVPLAYWYDSSSATQGQPIAQVSWEEYNRLKNMDTSQTAERPTYFALAHWDTGWEVSLWPAPESNGGELRMQWWHPELPFDPEIDATTRTVQAPARPIYLGAVYLALNERGEELGEPGNLAESRYYKALTEAKESDMLNTGRVNRFEFYRD